MQSCGAIKSSQPERRLPNTAVSEECVRAPQFAVPWTSWREQIASSFHEAFHGPKPQRNFSGETFFHDCSIERRFPMLAFSAAVVCHAVLILFPFPIWNTAPRRATLSSQTEVTWYGPLQYLPPLVPKKALPRRASAVSANLQAAAETFHPRQSIITEPLHPTHPRQTLLQTNAPLELPKIVPVLPNIIQLPVSQPARPKLQLSARQLRAIRPAARTHREVRDIVAPEVAAPQNEAGVINIASTPSLPKPVLLVNSMSAPYSISNGVATSAANVDVPALGSGSSSSMLIALSAMPGPPVPVVVPSGTLSAKISVAPGGTQPGSATSDSTGQAALPGGGHGPDGIFVGEEKAANPSRVSGLGISPSSPRAAIPLPSKPASRLAPPSLDSSSSRREGPAILQPGMSPDAVLGAKRIYTLQVNMPNFTSASGSWILNFAELNEERAIGYVNPETSRVAAPVPLRKVDPKYPPELREGHVEGEVVLYAVIRKDGTVDNIQLVRGVDAQLNANAMEALAQWKFQPGEKYGAPVDLEAVVHIPFRSRATIN